MVNLLFSKQDIKTSKYQKQATWRTQYLKNMTSNLYESGTGHMKNLLYLQYEIKSSIDHMNLIWIQGIHAFSSQNIICVKYKNVKLTNFMK